MAGGGGGGGECAQLIAGWGVRKRYAKSNTAELLPLKTIICAVTNP